MNKLKTTLAGLAVLLIICCTPQLYIPMSTDQAQQEILLKGRKLYVGHCGSCHNLHLPKERDKEAWFRQLNVMQEKAKITDQEKELIFQYLTYQPKL